MPERNPNRVRLTVQSIVRWKILGYLYNIAARSDILSNFPLGLSSQIAPVNEGPSGISVVYWILVRASFLSPLTLALIRSPSRTLTRKRGFAQWGGKLETQYWINPSPPGFKCRRRYLLFRYRILPLYRDVENKFQGKTKSDTRTFLSICPHVFGYWGICCFLGDLCTCIPWRVWGLQI